MTARDRTTPMDRATHDAGDRVLASVGALEDATPQVLESANTVANGGALTALPTMLKDGLPDTGRSGPAAKGVLRPDHDPAHLGARRMGLLLGLDRCPEIKTLREKIRLIAGSPDTVHQWQIALAECWAADLKVDPVAVI